jgi:hypothetical protein
VSSACYRCSRSSHIGAYPNAAIAMVSRLAARDERSQPHRAAGNRGRASDCSRRHALETCPALGHALADRGARRQLRLRDRFLSIVAADLSRSRDAASRRHRSYFPPCPTSSVPVRMASAAWSATCWCENCRPSEDLCRSAWPGPPKCAFSMSGWSSGPISNICSLRPPDGSINESDLFVAKVKLRQEAGVRWAEVAGCGNRSALELSPCRILIRKWR